MTETRYKYTDLFFSAAIIVAGGFMAFNFPLSINSEGQSNLPDSQVVHQAEAQIAGAATSVEIESEADPKLSMPISIGLARVTKKTFGLKVTPETSPVDNDVFSGYHTGIDFEVFPNEENIDVPITAACEGKVMIKTWAKGYGGVLSQSCVIDGQDVTVIYGHLKLESITAVPGQVLLTGEKIGDLGQGYTRETDGRRKHLHFDIHKGTELNILGYVPEPDDLAHWIDPVKYLK